MKIDVLRPKELTAHMLSTWTGLQREDPTLGSPFLSPGYVLAVDAIRDDVEVAVIQQASEVVGFFPYQRDGHNVGRPVGLKMSDFQGVIVGRDVVWDARSLVQSCRLTAWHFDHLIASQRPFQPHHWACADSPYMDLSQGFEAYKSQQSGGTALVSQIGRKRRQIEREIGPILFDTHSQDRGAFNKLLAWKSAQLNAMKTPSVLRFPWVVELLDRIRITCTEHFEGMLSTLYAGDHLVAIHFGMRAGSVLHSWVPAYDVTYAKYSPGMIQLFEIAEAAASSGVTRFDFGKGNEVWKARSKSDDIRLAEGSVDTRPLARTVNHGWYRTKKWIRDSPLRQHVQAPKRAVQRLRQWIVMR